MKKSKVLLSVVLITSLVIASPSYASSDDKNTPDLLLIAAGTCMLIFKRPIFLIPIGITLIFSATCPEIAKKQLNNAIKHAPSAYEKIKNGCKKKLENNSKKDSNPILEKDLEENKKKNMENK